MHVLNCYAADFVECGSIARYGAFGGLWFALEEIEKYFGAKGQGGALPLGRDSG